MKYILVIGDGMADNKVPELENKTPLERAQKATIDALSKKSQLGSVLTVPEGLPPGSDTAILSIFGYCPKKYYTGRAPLEASGCGVKLADGDTAYRVNMVALSDGNMPFAEKTMLSHSGGSVEGEESIQLMEYLESSKDFVALCEKLAVRFYKNPSFRHIGVQKNAVIKGLVTTPPHDILSEKIGTYLPKGTADATGLLELMELANALLKDHPCNKKRKDEGKLPANGIWFWAEGTVAALPDFKEKTGKSGAVISAVPLVFGIGNLAGLTPVTVDGATGELDTNYEGKAAAALEALKTYDFVCVHVEAPDECTHCGDLEGKLTAIENLSERVIKPLVDGMKEPFRLLLLSDHKTLTSTRTHDGGPVPYLLFDSEIDGGSCLPYNEETAKSGQYFGDGTHIIEQLFLR